MPFLKLIRFPNLIIVFLTQYLLQYLILIPTFDKGNLSPLLDHFHFFILVLSTMVIAAGGYIINDLEDYEIDLLNKPDKVIINKHISAYNAHLIYWGLTGFGFLISLYLAFYVDNLPLLLIYPFAVLLLYLYSKALKKSILWGNLIVSLFCAFVAGIVLFAERENVFQLTTQNSDYGSIVLEIFTFYMLFAFFATMFREIVKDIEDVDGDKKLGCTTMPIAWGTSKAKGVALFFAIIFLGILMDWILSEEQIEIDAGLIYLVIGIILPMLFAMYKLLKANTKKEFHFISQLAKYIMFSGILYLLVWSFF